MAEKTRTVIEEADNGYIATNFLVSNPEKGPLWREIASDAEGLVKIIQEKYGNG